MWGNIMEELEIEQGDVEDVDHDEMTMVWSQLTPEQKEYFKKIAEKNEENLRYIG